MTTIPEYLQLDIISPEKQVVSTMAKEVVAPCTDGYYGFMAGHTYFDGLLDTGILYYTDDKGEEHDFFACGGFVQVTPERVRVLVDIVESPEEIDYQRAEQALKRAQERLAHIDDTIDTARAQAALARALYRLKIVEKVKYRRKDL